MLNWLKSLFGAPQPAGPPQALKSFTASDPTITKDSIRVESDAWRVKTEGDRTVRFFEIPDPGVEQCILTYRAQIKTEAIIGRTYLEMWCRFPGGGEFFSKGFDNALKGTNDWSSCEIPFYLKKGQRPDLLKLNLVVEGGGEVWIRSIELLFTPIQ
jgi:hypothetical protein